MSKKKHKNIIHAAKIGTKIIKQATKNIPVVGLATDIALSVADKYLRCNVINNIIYMLRAMVAETMYAYDYDKLTNKENKRYIQEFKKRRDDSILLARCVLALYGIRYYHLKQLIKDEQDEKKELEYMEIQTKIKAIQKLLKDWWRLQGWFGDNNKKKLEQLDQIVHEDMIEWKRDINEYFDDIAEATTESLEQLGKKYATDAHQYIREHITTENQKIDYIEDIIEKMLVELQKDLICKGLRKGIGHNTKKFLKF